MSQAAGVVSRATEAMAPAGGSASAAAQPRPRRVAFFGNFGTQNLGNEYTLAAMLANARRRMPGAELIRICTDPKDTAARHGVTATSMSYRYSSAFLAAARRMSEARLVRALRRLFVRVPREVVEMVRAFRSLKGVSMLVMTGTGMLSDVGIGPFDLHWEILKWSAVAKLRGAKLAFASVGVGPIASRASRWIVKRALSLADYRSYRDAWSRSYLQSIGFESSRDSGAPRPRLQPASASARAPRRPPPRRRRGPDGLLRHAHEPAGRRGGLPRLCRQGHPLRLRLLERGYDVRLLIGDVSYDTRSKNDVLQRLRDSAAPPAEGRVVAAPINSPEQLLEEIGRTDVVVAMRFHTALLALMLQKPVVALSYHQKCIALMESVGLPQHSHDIDRSDAERLIEQFAELERNSDTFPSYIAAKAGECRIALDEQYAQLFG